jgi:hypothetical protein
MLQPWKMLMTGCRGDMVRRARPLLPLPLPLLSRRAETAYAAAAAI